MNPHSTTRTDPWTLGRNELYLVATQKRKNRQDMTGKINGWKNILNTLTVHYGDRIAANTIN